MKKFFKFSILVTAYILLNGCVRYETVWVNYQNPNANLNADRMYCEKDSVSVYPTTFQNVQMQQGECFEDEFGDMECISDAYQNIDLNQENRESYYNNCMNLRGWTLETHTYNNKGQRIN